MKAWWLGHDISGDEQTIGFQGRHSDKLHTTYKAEGDGFQCDALCESGFHGCFTFEISRHPETGQGRDILHFMQEFWQCLTSLKQNITTAGLTISIFLQDLQKQQSHTRTRFESQV